MSRSGQLVVLGAECADVIPLDTGPLVLGREPNPVDGEEGLILPSKSVSRRHCVIEPGPDGHCARDLESTNGLFVNDRQAEEACLEPFDRLRVGEYLLVYLDGKVDPYKVLGLMGRLDETAIVSLPSGPTRLDDELLSLVLGIPEFGAQGELLPLLDTLLGELRRMLVPCDGLSLVLLEPGEAGAERVRVIDGRAGLDDGEVQRLAPLVAEALACRQALRGPGLQDGGGLLCFPLEHHPWTGAQERRHVRAEVRGALLLELPGNRRLSAKSQELLLALARQLAILLSNARLHRQATVDTLTGLANRRSLELALSNELDRAEREGSSLGVLLLDVDDFKRINDEHGHHVGDVVLRSLGALLPRALRADDLAGRWGGEEFLVLLPGTGLAGSETVARKLAARVAAAAPLVAGVPQVSVSGGVAVFPDHGRNPALLVQRADEALYAAKRAGKRCIRRYGEPDRGQGESDPDRTQRVHGRGEAARPTPPASAWLLSELRAPIPLRRGTTVSLGRSEACDVVLSFPTVSRLHAVLQVDAQGAMLLHDASSNGVRINTRPLLADAAPVQPGDRIEIGPYGFEVSEERGASGMETQAGSFLSGRLEPNGLGRLLLRLSGLECTGLLVVRERAREGRLELRAGQLVRARAGELKNEQALAELLAVAEGTYTFTRERVEGEREVEVSVLDLVRRARPGPGIHPRDLLADPATRAPSVLETQSLRAAQASGSSLLSEPAEGGTR